MLLKMVNMSNKNNTVKIRLNVGEITIEIETTLENVEEAVRKAVQGIQEAQISQPKQKEAREGRGVTTCLDLLERLIAEGWFAEPRSLSDVVGELARRGYHYDPTAVSHGLLDLVRRMRLIREGRPKRYLYRVARELPPKTGEEARDEAVEVETEARRLD
ncbi:MAG: hypothetical protein QXO86_04990 [Nitrososphaerota archaeon]